MDPNQTPSKPTPKYRQSPLTIDPTKQAIVEALLESNTSYRNIQKATGLAQTTISKIRFQKRTSTPQVENIKKNLRNRFALIADKSLNHLDDSKLADASAKDLIYIAHKASEMALGGTPSIVETYSQTLKNFMQPEDTTTCSVPGEIVKTVTITKTDTA